MGEYRRDETEKREGGQTMASDKTCIPTTAATDDDIGTDTRLAEARAVQRAFDEFLGQLGSVIMRGVNLERAFEEPTANVANAMSALVLAWGVLKCDLELLQLIIGSPGIEIVTRPAMRLAYDVLDKVYPRCLLYVAHHGTRNSALLDALFNLAERVAEEHRRFGAAPDVRQVPPLTAQSAPVVGATPQRGRLARCERAARSGHRWHLLRSMRERPGAA